MADIATTACNAKIVDGLAAGLSYRDVGAMVGMDAATVLRRGRKMRPRIEAEAIKYFEANLGLATGINSHCLQAAQQLYESLPPSELSAHAPLLVQAHKIADRILQSVGIAPSLAPSLTVQQFVQINATTVVAPQLSALFTPEALQAATGDIVEAEWQESGEQEPEPV